MTTAAEKIATTIYCAQKAEINLRTVTGALGMLVEQMSDLTKPPDRDALDQWTAVLGWLNIWLVEEADDLALALNPGEQGGEVAQ